MKSYRDVLDYMYSQLPMYHRSGAAAYKANLDNTHAIDKLLGAPHTIFKTIHVAGTNGKGSVSHMLAAALACAGYKTGLYTSPHLKDFRERIRINGEMMSEKAVTDFVIAHRTAFEKIQPSFFEMTVGMAFDYFAAEKVDVAVIEVGLGGRLDSTNIITPVLSVITSIGMDHMNLLGDTIEKIATEKAGIIKPKTPVIISETQANIEQIFRERAKEMNAPILFADKEMAHAQRDSNTMKEVNDSGEVSQTYKLGLVGGYQTRNVRCVMLATRILNKNGFKIDNDALGAALAHVVSLTGLRGRWEKLSNNPLTYCDVGHNEDGMREVVAMIEKTPHEHLHMVLGVVNDKDVNAILRLLPTDATYYFCKASIPRALDEKELQRSAAAHQLIGEAYADVPLALEAARANATAHDLVFVGGSTFTVADAL